MAKQAPGPLAPVHVIVGEDSYLAEEALQRILADAIGDDRAEALTVLYGDEAKWERVVNEARSGSLFATRRAVVVRRADLIRGPKEDDDEAAGASSSVAERGAKKKPKKDEDPSVKFPVLKYLEEPASDATLVLLATKPDRRSNPWNRLCKDAKVHSAEPLKGRALRAYVEEDLRRRGLRLTGDAVGALIDEVGQDLRRLMGEVQKLEAWGAEGAKAALSADEVLDVLGRGMARPLYLLADCVAARDVSGSVEKVQELLDADEEEFKFKILVTAHRSLRQVRAARALRERRLPPQKVAEALLPPNMQFKRDALMAAASRWSDEDLGQALLALEKADRRMKRGSDAATTLVAALAEVCRSATGSTSRRGR